MFTYLCGTLTEREENIVTVENQGIGFEIVMGPVLALKLGEIGSQVKVYTHFHVTQDGQQLFGFPDAESRKLFRLLITVSGIGPKAALNVLEVFSPEVFAVHVIRSDSKALMQVKGLGKKSAERIIIDLRDKLAKSEWAENTENQVSAEQGLTNFSQDDMTQMQSDILQGLGYLGYQPQEAKRLVKASFDPELDLETNLRRAMAAGHKA